ncbi:MAG: MarC family protein [Trichodesmium sp.]
MMINPTLLDFISYMGTTLASLFAIANPIGSIPIFYSLTSKDSRCYQIEQAQKTAINVTLILMVFLFIGSYILNFFGLSLAEIQIAGGLIVGHTAWGMVTTKQMLTQGERQEATDREDVSFTPMALPLIAGPGAIGVAISQGTQAKQLVQSLGCAAGVLLLGIIVYLCLILGKPLIDRIGQNGIGALNRIFGFLILSIAVELIAGGVTEIIKKLAPILLQS